MGGAGLPGVGQSVPPALQHQQQVPPQMMSLQDIERQMLQARAMTGPAPGVGMPPNGYPYPPPHPFHPGATPGAPRPMMFNPAFPPHMIPHGQIPMARPPFTPTGGHPYQPNVPVMTVEEVERMMREMRAAPPPSALPLPTTSLSPTDPSQLTETRDSIAEQENAQEEQDDGMDLNLDQAPLPSLDDALDKSNKTHKARRPHFEKLNRPSQNERRRQQQQTNQEHQSQEIEEGTSRPKEEGGNTRNQHKRDYQYHRHQSNVQEREFFNAPGSSSGNRRKNQQQYHSHHHQREEYHERERPREVSLNFASRAE